MEKINGCYLSCCLCTKYSVLNTCSFKKEKGRVYKCDLFHRGLWHTGYQDRFKARIDYFFGEKKLHGVMCVTGHGEEKNFKENKMILKAKIAISYYILFLVVLPLIAVLFTMIYFQYIPLGPGMLIIVFSLPFLLLPFVFEYYTFDGTYLKVKNVLGITTKKVAFSDYEDIYGLDKTHGKYALASTSFYIVDKKERVISLKSYYCQNLEEFIIKLSKGKTLREDRAELHSLKIELKKDSIYFILLVVLTLMLTMVFIRGIIEAINMQHHFQWWFTPVIGFLFWLVYQSGRLLKESYKEYKLVRQKVLNRTIRLGKMDKRFKYKYS